MVFRENEVIELDGGKKYIVVYVLEHEGSYYYYVCEVNQEETSINPVFKIITTVKENSNVFVKTVKDELANELELEFKEKLNIE